MDEELIDLCHQITQAAREKDNEIWDGGDCYVRIPEGFIYELEGRLARIETSEEATARRYEVRDAETGEIVEGPAFILTPTGKPLYSLTEPQRLGTPDGAYVAGAYYTRPEVVTRRLDKAAHDIMPDVVARQLVRMMPSYHLPGIRDIVERRMEREARDGTNQTTSAAASS